MTMKRGWWLKAVLLSLGLLGAAAQAGQVLVPEQSTITFVGKQMGVPAERCV